MCLGTSEVTIPNGMMISIFTQYRFIYDTGTRDYKAVTHYRIFVRRNHMFSSKQIDVDELEQTIYTFND